MGRYKVLSGQNIYDVALTVYGSIEGITDLLMNNPDLSFDSRLCSGDELLFTDDYVINEDILSYNRLNRITPANGERNVYMKEPVFPQFAEIDISNMETSVGFSLSGVGDIEIDWGDNSPIQRILIDDSIRSLRHTFDNNISKGRKVRFYAENNLALNELNLTELKPLAIYLYRPLYVERFVLCSAHLALDFIGLLEGTFRMELMGVKTSSLLPVALLPELMNLDLTGVRVLREVVDEYLIYVAENYGRRRNCQVKLSSTPSGVYDEPTWDENYKYIYTSGMEAIWVITNEPAWNEAGLWSFDINGTIYSKNK